SAHDASSVIEIGDAKHCSEVECPVCTGYTVSDKPFSASCFSTLPIITGRTTGWPKGTSINRKAPILSWFCPPLLDGNTPLLSHRSLLRGFLPLGYHTPGSYCLPLYGLLWGS